ncbi:MAG: hypothetical protein OEZ22_10050 [Spirochaetia bacterium]|nr:hypothetical protein [Spirochaetia bacterium]
MKILKLQILNLIYKKELISIFLILAFACKTPEKIETEPETLQVITANIFTDSIVDKKYFSNEGELIREKIISLIHALLNHNIETIISQIHSEIGAYADIKSPMGYKEIVNEIENPMGLLYITFWDTSRLKQMNPDIEILSFQEIFSKVKIIYLDLFFYSTEECEIYLNFKNRPSLGILGNPVYHKVDGIWYLKRLF